MKREKQSLFYYAEYLRLSREDGDKAESDSIGNQRKLIEGFLKDKEEFVLYDTYIDDGFSGTNFNRPAFGRMIKDIECGKVNCVIVKDLSRFGRDYIDTGKYLERYFPDRDVRFISITDNIDSRKQAYDMLLPIKNIFNEQYARDISGKVHAAIRTKQKAGEFIGAFPSYGYKKSPSDKNRLIIDECAAEVVRMIFSLFVSGYSKRQITAILNEQGIVCPSVYKRLNKDLYKNNKRWDDASYWTYSTVNHILRNEMYIGNMVQGRKTRTMRGREKQIAREDWIVVPETHEAIINRETWDKAQDLIAQRARSAGMASNSSIFAGFLKCGDCGRALVKKAGTPGHGGGAVNYYCGTYVHSGRTCCASHSISHKVLEQIVLEDLRAIIGRMENLQDIVASQRTDSTAEKVNESERAGIRLELDRVRKLKKAVYEDYRGGLLSKEEFISCKKDYLAKEDILGKRLQSVEEQEESRKPENVFELPWVRRLLEMKDVEKLDRDIVVEMLHEIRVYENRKIKIVYKFSDELATFSENPAPDFFRF